MINKILRWLFKEKDQSKKTMVIDTLDDLIKKGEYANANMWIISNLSIKGVMEYSLVIGEEAWFLLSGNLKDTRPSAALMCASNAHQTDKQGAREEAISAGNDMLHFCAESEHKSDTLGQVIAYVAYTCGYIEPEFAIRAYEIMSCLDDEVLQLRILNSGKNILMEEL